MKASIVNRPSAGVQRMLSRKLIDPELRQIISDGDVQAVGICQGTVLEILVAADIAEKTADVLAGEISGSCPQHMTCLAVMGSTSAVRAAVDAIKLAVSDMQ